MSTDCFHNFTVSKSVAERKIVSFWVDFLVKNTGYRGTTIEDIELTFENSGKKYKMKKQYYRGDCQQDRRISIPSSKSVDLSVDFWEEFTGNEEDKIECVFTIFHTYKAETVKFTSVRKESASR